MTATSYTPPTFGVVDYIVFAAFLAISSGVGIFFSFSQKTTGEYFLGNRQMHPIPVGISTGVSFLSASMLVGMPAEIYINGYMYLLGPVTGSLGFFLGSMLIALVLHSLNMTSLQQYFSRRYNSRAIAVSANLLVLLCIFQYMGVCMLGSVIAFNSVTGGQVSVVTGLVIGGAVGIFYTAIGGLKAVVWADVIQSVIMIGGTIVVVIKSTLDTAGGFGAVMEVNRKYQRIHPPDWSTDPTVRHTMWGMIFGAFVQWGVWSAQPANVQRLCAAPGKGSAVIIASIASLLFIVFSLLPGFAGFSIFAFYSNRGCDVYAAKWIEQNEIILYYIREQLNWTGFQGLFMAALYAGSLSSLSSGLNAASAIMWNDLLKVHLFPDLSEVKSTLFSKLLVLTFGILSMIWCYGLYSFGGMIIQVCSSINGAIYGSYFTIFLLAVCCFWAQWKGALAGIVVGTGLTLTLSIGSLIKGDPQVAQLPTIIDHCSWPNASSSRTTPPSLVMTRMNSTNNSSAKGLFSISYMWLGLICVTLTFFTGILASLCTGAAKDVDGELILAPCRHNRRRRRCVSCCGKKKGKSWSPQDPISAPRNTKELQELENFPLEQNRLPTNPPEEDSVIL